ncbi:MAG: hypothetical protein AAB867_03220, partial [Patescibacteria group bacterium]
HTFLATFRISRLTQGGGVLVSPDGGSHSSYTIAIPEGANATAYKDQQIRTDQDGRFALADPSVLESVEEFVREAENFLAKGRWISDRSHNAPPFG